MDSPYYFEATRFWSPGDEKAHFDWRAGIGCVRGARGELHKLLLDIDPAAVTASDLDELQGIYRRYGGDLTQLESLRRDGERE